MKNVTSIHGYCKEINVSPPRHAFFDIRQFEENMKTVNALQHPFRHEFYCIALRHSGSNVEVLGKPLTASLFFNSPYQIITWDILPDWKGWYIIFGREFIGMNKALNNFILDYPFFRLDKHVSFDLPEKEVQEAEGYFRKIYEEYHSDRKDKFQFIQAYTTLLLSITKRYFEELHIEEQTTEGNRTADILLVSRFQTLIETLFTKETLDTEARKPSFYAAQLNVHPNYLNAVVKRITDKTASQVIQQYLTSFAKSFITQTNLSVKEIAYRLHFNEPTHFNAFFKKQTGKTPQQFREHQSL